MTAIQNGEELSDELAEQQISDALEAFNVDAYYDKLNEAHTNYVIEVAKSLDYIDWQDVITHSLRPNAYQSEAEALIDWYYDSWSEVEAHCGQVTESTQSTIEEIITPFNN